MVAILRSRASLYAAVAVLLCAAMVALCWPGVAMYDSVVQYEQVLTGEYEDWHPPVMARLWEALHLLGPGQGPMFVLQLLFYWLGFGMIAATLAREGAPRAGAAALAVGAFPLFSGWEVSVLKDTQMAAAMVAATGIVGWWRLGERPVPWPAVAAAALLLAYAVMVRANAVFAVVPLAFGLFSLARGRSAAIRVGLALFATVAVIAVTPAINQRLFGASPSGVERSLLIFDLAGIAHYAGPEAAPTLPPADWQFVEQRHCYTPFFWDPLDSASRCGAVLAAASVHAPGRSLAPDWISAAAHHPIAYAEHRLGHWNSTMRWIVPAHWPLALPQTSSEPNEDGLGSPGKGGDLFLRTSQWFAGGPLAIPALWLVAAFGAIVAARAGQTPRQRLAFALAISAAALELSFLLVSLASDLRYHLWSMIAVALAWVLLAERTTSRRAVLGTLVALLVFAIPAEIARLALPPAQDSYNWALG